jgi:hypothetical protein
MSIKMQVELDELRQKVAELSERVAELEKPKRDTLSLKKDAPRG